MSSNKFRLLAARGSAAAMGVVIALAAGAAYANSFGVPFLLDDSVKIADNASIKDLRHLGAILSPQALTIAGRPLLNLTFALNYAWSGEQVGSYHLFNLAVHLLAGLTLLGIVRRTLLSPGLRRRWEEAALPLGGVIAAVWVLHPLQTESVTYLSQRAESLMGLFYLLILYCFIRGVAGEGAEPSFALRAAAGEKAARRRSLCWFGLSCLACLFGMATKEVMVTAPFVVLLYDRAFVAGSFREAVTKRRLYYAGLAAAWLFLGFLLGGARLNQRGAGFHVGVSGLAYGLTELKVVADYVKLSVWPHPLVFDYGPEMAAATIPQVAPFALLVLAMVIAAVGAWRYSKPLGFVAVSFFILLSPTSSFVPVAFQPMAESRMYLPLACLVTLAVLGGYAWGGRTALAALVLAAAGSGALTIERNRDYRSALRLWEDTVLKRPGSSRAQNNLGNELEKVPGRQSEARARFEESLRINPDYPEAHNNLGTVLAKIPGHQSEALTQYREALRINPDFALAHNNLGSELSKLPGQLPQAIAQYEEALRLNPDLAEAHYNLATVLAKFPDRRPEAIALFRQALRIQPDYPEAQNNLATVLAPIPGRRPEAIALYEQAIGLDPHYAEAHGNFALVLENIPGRQSEALAHFQEALRLEPNNAEAHYNLANLLAATPGRLAEAIVHYEQALRIRPDYAEAHNNLATVLAGIPDRWPEALAHFGQALRIKPDYAEAHFDLAVLLARIPGRQPEAIAHYEQALRINPDYAEAHYNLAVLLAVIPGRRSEAIAHDNEALRIRPDYPDAQNNLAVAYAMGGRWDEAIRHFEMALKLDPTNRSAQENLEKLRAAQKLRSQARGSGKVDER